MGDEQRGLEMMALFTGDENVERGRAYLEALDPVLHRHIIEFVYGEVYAGEILDPKTRARQVAVYAGFPAAWNALATMKAALKDLDEEATS